MAINETWKLAPWADVLYACDARWWEFRGPTSAEFRGVRVIGEAEVPGYVCAHVRADYYYMIWNTDEIGGGGNSGFQALNLVSRWGVKRVLLTGFDCQGGHWHGAHENGLANPRATTQRKWVEAFNHAAPVLSKLGIEVINCSRKTALECFPRDKLEDAL